MRCGKVNRGGKRKKAGTEITEVYVVLIQDKSRQSGKKAQKRGGGLN